MCYSIVGLPPPPPLPLGGGHREYAILIPFKEGSAVQLWSVCSDTCYQSLRGLTPCQVMLFPGQPVSSDWKREEGLRPSLFSLLWDTLMSNAHLRLPCWVGQGFPRLISPLDFTQSWLPLIPFKDIDVYTPCTPNSTSGKPKLCHLTSCPYSNYN